LPKKTFSRKIIFFKIECGQKFFERFTENRFQNRAWAKFFDSLKLDFDWIQIYIDWETSRRIGSPIKEINLFDGNWKLFVLFDVCVF
jgi:hypothetical protein